MSFVDNAAVDPTDDAIVYTAQDRFELDYTKSPGRQWTWKSHTVDRFAHPDDGRLGSGARYVTPVVEVIQGRKLLFLTGMYQVEPRFFRFEGEIAVPSTAFSTNGWGWQVSDDGDVWNAGERDGIHRYRLRGFDANGNPEYGERETTPMPAPFERLQRVHYDAAHDVMYLAGWTHAHPRPQGSELEKLVGSEIARYDRWSAGNRHPRWRLRLPLARVGRDLRDIRAPIGLSVAGSHLFVVEMGTSRVRAYRTSDRRLVGDWSPGPSVGSFVGVVDVPDGIRAFRRRDGSYLVFVEEDHAAKVLL